MLIKAIAYCVKNEDTGEMINGVVEGTLSQVCLTVTSQTYPNNLAIFKGRFLDLPDFIADNGLSMYTKYFRIDVEF